MNILSNIKRLNVKERTISLIVLCIFHPALIICTPINLAYKAFISVLIMGAVIVLGLLIDKNSYCKNQPDYDELARFTIVLLLGLLPLTLAVMYPFILPLAEFINSAIGTIIEFFLNIVIYILNLPDLIHSIYNS